ncbi:MAG: site-2 protease family protein, partial [Candidatus Margulisbacteria bacterium]|nr:site-2 protease family protein [Candidatus Margulisiibacteriota bacterium]
LYNILPLQGIQHSYGLYLTASILVSCVQINLILAIFNLFPIPPLDGSRVLMNFLPPDLQSKLARLEPYGFVIILVLAYLGLFQFLFMWILTPLMHLLL